MENSTENSSRLNSQNISPELQKVLGNMRVHTTTNPNLKTFMYDEDLPNLPLPDLTETMERYIKSCSALVSEAELNNTREAVSSFLKNEGPILHQKLQNKALQEKNWLEDWWFHYAYLTQRQPLIPYCNTAGPETLVLSSWTADSENVFKNATFFLYTNLCYCKNLQEEKIRPQSSVKGQKFSMDQFKRLYNTTRIPGKQVDSLYSTWKTKREGECPHHVIILCNGHIWRMEPHDSRGEVLSPSELEEQLRYIRYTSDSLGEGPGVAALTCDERDTWADNRAWLKSVSPYNAAMLEEIESAVLVVVLDSSTPQTMSEVCWEFLCGDGCNRWADKSLSAIITRNGYIGTSCDHTPYDGMVLVYMSDYQRQLIKLMEAGLVKHSSNRAHLTPPRRLEFTLDPLLHASIAAAKLKSRINNEKVLTCFREFKGFGKAWMKEMKVHPDALVQMGLQLAYYRSHQTFAPTYETATTRQFYHGRTETTRSCTPQAKKFVLMMEDSNVSQSDKRQSFVDACAAHDNLMRVCQQGEGVDRHMLGLYLTAVEQGHEVPALFLDPSFTKSGGGGNYILSTSTIGYTDTMGGVAPMVPNGYGTFYSMLPEKIYFFVSSFKNGGTLTAEQFTDMIAGSLESIRVLLEGTRNDGAHQSKL